MIDKIPQYQLLFDDKDRLIESFQLVYCSLNNSHTDNDKSKGYIVFKQLVENFFSLKLPCENIETFTEDEAWILLSDDFLPKRLENLHKPLDSVLDEIKEMESDESKEATNETHKTSKQARKKQLQNIPPSEIMDIEEVPEKLFLFKMQNEDMDKFLLLYKYGEHTLMYSGQHIYSYIRHILFLYERLQMVYN